MDVMTSRRHSISTPPHEFERVDGLRAPKRSRSIDPNAIGPIDRSDLVTAAASDVFSPDQELNGNRAERRFTHSVSLEPERSGVTGESRLSEEGGRGSSSMSPFEDGVAGEEEEQIIHRRQRHEAGEQQHAAQTMMARPAMQRCVQNEGNVPAIVKGYATTPRGQIHYRRCGQGHPVVLLHDLGRSSDMWSPVMPLLAARGCCAVAVDLPACGESTAVCRDFSLMEIGAITVAAVINVGFAQQFDLIGHGFGASLALQMATVFPTRIRKLAVWGIMPQGERTSRLQAAEEALSGAGGIGDAEAAALIGLPGDAGAAQRAVAAAVEQALTRRANQDVPIDQMVQSVLEALQSLPARSPLLKAHALANHEELFGKVLQPVLCLAGCDDPFQFESMMSASKLGKGKYYHLNGAGTDVVVTHPQQYVQTVVEFLGQP